jgi:cytochrome c oxidase cbb3-type subunit 2
MTWVFSTAVALLLSQAARADDAPAPPSPAAVDRAANAYARYCMVCHGVNGDGRGPSAQWVDPRPRDFTQALYKWRSTPSGSLPLDGDLFRTIRNGVYSTYMLPWIGLTDSETRDLVAYVEHFGKRFETEPRGAPIAIPPEPADSPEARERGKQLFAQACASCHGAEGHGDGEATKSPGLFDEGGNRIWPLDLTLGRFKTCRDDRDLYRVLSTGLDGTPMPAYAQGLTPAQLWDLVQYVMSMAPRSGG